MLERFLPATPETPPNSGFTKIIVPGEIDKKSETPRLSPISRWALFTAGIVRDAQTPTDDIEIILSTDSEESARLLEEYLHDAFDVPTTAITREITDASEENSAEEVKKIMGKHSKTSRVGLISPPIDKKTQQLFNKAGIKPQHISPEDLLHRQIGSSPHAIGQVALEFGQQLLKFGNVTAAGHVALYDLEIAA